MLKYLQFLFEILAGSAIAFVGSMLTFIDKNYTFGILIIIIGIVVYFIAIKNSPKNKDKHSKFSLSGGKRFFCVCLALLSSFILFVIAIDDTYSDVPVSDSTTTSKATAAKETTTTTKSTTKETTTTTESTTKKTTTTTESTTKKTTTTTESTTSKEDYKNSCVELEYEKIARNPDKYKGKNLKFKGEVIQCEKSFGTSYYARINVTLNQYGLYEDTIYVTFKIPKGEDRILDGDIVEVYGICTGEKSYLSIFGEQITIPGLDALYIELVK